MELKTSPTEIPPLLLIREHVEALAQAQAKVQIALNAMREEELHAFILNWRTTEEMAMEAYERLRQLDLEKYPPLNTLS